MLVIFGAAIGVWLLYLIIALFSKHHTALIVATIIGVVAGVCSIAAGGDGANTLLGALLFWFLTALIPKLQINNQENKKGNSKNESKALVEKPVVDKVKNIKNDEVKETEAKHDYKTFDNCMLLYLTTISPGKGVYSGVSYTVDVDYFYNFDEKKRDDFKSIIGEIIAGLFNNQYNKNDSVQEHEFMVFVCTILDRVKGINQDMVTTIENGISNKLNKDELYELTDAKLFIYEFIDEYFNKHINDNTKPLRSTRQEPIENEFNLVSHKEVIELSNKFKDYKEKYSFDNVRICEKFQISDSNCSFYIFEENKYDYYSGAAIKYMINIKSDREDCYLVVRYIKENYYTIEYVDFDDDKISVIDLGLISSTDKQRDRIYQRTFAYLKRLIEQ